MKNSYQIAILPDMTLAESLDSTENHRDIFQVNGGYLNGFNGITESRLRAGWLFNLWPSPVKGAIRFQPVVNAIQTRSDFSLIEQPATPLCVLQQLNTPDFDATPAKTPCYKGATQFAP